MTDLKKQHIQQIKQRTGIGGPYSFASREDMAYIVDVFRTLRSWGYTLYKTDFLVWGMQDSAKVKRHTPRQDRL